MFTRRFLVTGLVSVLSIFCILSLSVESKNNDYEKQMSRFDFEEARVQYREGAEDTLEKMEKYVEIHPEDVDAAMALAGIYLDLSKEALARRLYEQVVEIDPDNRDAHRQLLLLYGWGGEMSEKTITKYETLLALEPSDLEMRRGLALKYVELNRHKDAIAQYEQLVKQDPSDVKSREMLADLYLWSGMSQKSAKQYRLVLKTFPENNKVLLNLGDIYYDFGLYDSAGKCYRRAIPSEDVALRYQQRIEEIEKKKKPKTGLEYYHHWRGDGYKHSYYSWNGGQYFNDYLDYLVSYYRREYVQNRTSIDADSYELKITNHLMNLITVTEKLVVNSYSPGDEHLNGSLTVRKNFYLPLYIEGSLSYEDVVSEVPAIEAEIEALFSEIYLYYNFKPSWSLTSRIKYGDYCDDNEGWEAEFGLTRHIKKVNPLLDLSYTYSQVSFNEPDSTAKTYPYWNPENYEVHSLILGLKNEKKDSEKKFVYLLQETVAYAIQDSAWMNGFRARLEYHRHKRPWSLFADYSRADTITGSVDTRFEEWSFTAGWNLYF